MAMQIISVDLQNEFCTEGGALYRPRSCVPFITDILLPFVRECGHHIAEIISDYRATEPGSSASSCVPGEWGYQSIITFRTKTSVCVGQSRAFTGLDSHGCWT